MACNRRVPGGCGCETKCPCVECENGIDTRRITAYTFNLSGVPNAPTNWHGYSDDSGDYYYRTTITGLAAFNGPKVFNLDSDCSLYEYDGEPVPVTYTWEKYSRLPRFDASLEPTPACPDELLASGSGEGVANFACSIHSISKPHDQRNVHMIMFLGVDPGVVLSLSYGAGTAYTTDVYTGEVTGTDPCKETPISGSMSNGDLVRFECDQAYSYPYSGTVTPTMETEGCNVCESNDIQQFTIEILDLSSETIIPHLHTIPTGGVGGEGSGPSDVWRELILDLTGFNGAYIITKVDGGWGSPPQHLITVSDVPYVQRSYEPVAPSDCPSTVRDTLAGTTSVTLRVNLQTFFDGSVSYSATISTGFIPHTYGATVPSVQFSAGFLPNDTPDLCDPPDLEYDSRIYNSVIHEYCTGGIYGAGVYHATATSSM